MTWGSNLGRDPNQIEICSVLMTNLYLMMPVAAALMKKKKTIAVRQPHAIVVTMRQTSLVSKFKICFNYIVFKICFNYIVFKICFNVYI